MSVTHSVHITSAWSANGKNKAVKGYIVYPNSNRVPFTADLEKRTVGHVGQGSPLITGAQKADILRALDARNA